MLELNIVFIKNELGFLLLYLSTMHKLQIRSWLHAKTVFNIQIFFSDHYPVPIQYRTNMVWFFAYCCYIQRNLQVSTNNFNSKLVLCGVESNLQLLSIRPRVSVCSFCDKYKYATYWTFWSGLLSCFKWTHIYSIIWWLSLVWWIIAS